LIGTTEPPSAEDDRLRAPGGGGPEMIPDALRPASNLFIGMPPLLMLAFGIVMGAAISFAVGVVVWSVFG
jgi:hypothetical protein